MEFIITLTENHKHLDFQVAESIVAAVKICNDSETANEFQINQADSNSYIFGKRLANGHIDWVRSDLEGIQRLR